MTIWTFLIRGSNLMEIQGGYQQMIEEEEL